MQYQAHQPPTLARRAVTLAVAVTLLLGTNASHPRSSFAADPNVGAAAGYLAARDGGRPDDYSVVHERTARLPHSDEPLWAAKLVDRRSGRVQIVYRDRRGQVGGPELAREQAQAAEARLSALGRKASPGLLDAAHRAAATGGDAPLAVAVWLDVGVAAAEAAVMARHPELTWLAGRPLSDDPSVIRRVRAELWTARRDAYANAAAVLATEVRRLGGSLAYASTSAPLVFLDLPAAAAASLAERTEVVSMGLEGSWSPAMNAAGQAVEANWTSGTGDTGAGIRVAVVEYHNVRSAGDLSGKVAATWSVTGTPAFTGSGTFDHPTWVAGAIAGKSSSYPGVAPGAVIVSAGTGGYTASLTYDRRVIAAADWAVSPGGGDADVVNTSLAQDTATGAEEARRFFDAIAYQDGRLPVSAAGNYVNFNGWQIASPGTGYNVVTVGGVDDRGTAARGDDRIWYVPGSNGSNWLDRPSDPWNAHGDYNKPNLVAPAVAVRTANGLTASGTSVATPIVAGIAAQLLSAEPRLLSWPEGARALLMAGAVHRVRMPGGAVNVDHEGVGMTSALWTGRIAEAGDGTWGGYRIGAVNPGETVRQLVSVRPGDRLRVALAWSSRATAAGGGFTDALTADLDLRVTAPDGTVLGSFTFDNAYEFVELPISASGAATIEILPARMDAGAERYGLAWAKVGDRTAPTARPVRPQDGEPWAVGSTAPRVAFSEPVSGVGPTTLALRAAGGSADIASSVAYDPGSRTATITPHAALAPGNYQLLLRAGVQDGALNAAAPASWTFTVADADGAASWGVTPARYAYFAPGTHVGYRFGSDSSVTASKSYRLGRASGAQVETRARLPGLPGVWLRVTNGIWAGYWIRESPAVHLPGGWGNEQLAPGTRVRVLAGTLVGYRYGGGGRVIGSRSYTLTRASGATVSQRRVINGRWHLYVVDGIWAGYWLPEAPRSHVAGALGLRDLGTARAMFASGTHVGSFHAPDGRVVSTRSFRLSRSSSAPVGGWAVVNGQPAFYVTAGVWTGYWVPESAGIHVP